MPEPLGLSLDRLTDVHAADFSWLVDQKHNFSDACCLTCGVTDQTTCHIYVGQSTGAVSCLNLLLLGVHKPRLLGHHGGHVKGICLLPWSPVNLVATCSADNTIKLWTHDPKALHGTKPCLQTLYGHSGSVTCVAAVHDCLVSGGTDGTLLLWKPADSSLLALPQFQLVGKLWSSQFWVLDLCCQHQPPAAGAGQGIFAAVANQPLLRLHLDKQAIQAASNGSTTQRSTFANVQYLPWSLTAFSSAAHSAQKHTSAAAAATGQALCTPTGMNSISSSHRVPPLSQLQSASGFRQQTGAVAGDSTARSSSSAALTAASKGVTAAVIGPGGSVFALQYLSWQLAVLSLSYDGCCRLHSAVDGALRCCWRSPQGSSYTAMDVTGTQGEVLLGDDRGCLHVYTLSNEKLLAAKQLTGSRITAVVCCSLSPQSESSSTSTSTSRIDTSTSSSSSHFVVLSANGLSLWQLRRGLGHCILPAGHRSAVVAVQMCHSVIQVDHRQAAAVDTVSRSITIPVNSNSSSSSTTVNSWLLSGGLDNRVLQWDLAAGPSVLSSHMAGAEDAELSALTYLQGCAALATGHDNGEVRLWRLDAGTHINLGPSGHSNTVTCLVPAVTAKGDELLLSGSFDGDVRLWEPRQLRGMKPHLLARFQAYGFSPENLLAAHHLASISAAALSNSGARVPAGRQPAGIAKDTQAVTWGQPGKEVLTSASATKATSTRADSPAIYGPVDALRLDSVGGDRWESPEVLCALFDQYKQLLVTGGNDGPIRVWDGSCSGELKGQHLGHKGAVNCLAMDGNFLFSGSNDSTVRVWDLLPPHFSSNNSSTDSVVCNCPSSLAVQVLHGHTAAVTGLAVVHATGILVSCGRDGKLLQWEYTTSSLLTQQQLPGQEFTCVAVTEDRGQVYAGTSQAQITSFRIAVVHGDDAANGEANNAVARH